MYEPREDSFLLLKHIKNYSERKRVLDMGTGSGILALELVKFADKVVATDIDDNVVNTMKQKIFSNFSNFSNLTVIKSDLFSNISEKFDFIAFNPPYLPSSKIKYREFDGGVHGTEIIEKFLSNAKKYLNDKGKILLLCSSLNKDIESLFRKYQYRFRKIDEQAFFFEKLFVYELE